MPRYVQPRDNRGAYAPPRYVRPYAYVPYRPYHFPRPYYSFRPRWNIGFGLWIGSPVPYPWSYFGGYVPRVYGYYNVLPGVQSYCGLSFDIQPMDAALYVDGEYVGVVGDFTPYGEPLTVVPGVHSVSIIHDGYRPLEFEVTIAAGEVIPYRGVMVQY